MKLKMSEKGRGQLARAALALLILLGLVAAMALAACAPRQGVPGAAKGGEKIGEEEGGASIPEMPAWSLESDCLTCHSLEADSAGDAATLYGFHASTGSDQSCISCHNQETELLKVHEKSSTDGSSAKKLTKTKVSSEQCLSCHNLDEIAATTAETTVLTDRNGTVVNPHQLPQNSDHEVIDCSDCHKMHTDKAQLPETAMETCTLCHHEKVFECGTCH